MFNGDDSAAVEFTLEKMHTISSRVLFEAITSHIVSRIPFSIKQI